MAEEREKTNPDYPVPPTWRPASHPGVRLPAPPLAPAAPLDPQTARVEPASHRPSSNSGYSVAPPAEESIRPFTHRPVSASITIAPVTQPAFVAPTIAPVVAPQQPPPPMVRPVSQPSFRPASDGYKLPGADGRPISATAVALRPTSGFGVDVHAGAGQSAAAVSRRAGDATRLLPWLRDKNKQFRALSSDDCHAMFKYASVHRVEANTILQAIDAPPTACFVVASGALVVRVRRHNGAYREMDRCGPGDVVGLLALVDPRPSPYEILAGSAAEVIAFESDQLAQHLAALSPDALAAMRAWTPFVIAQLRATQARVSRLTGIRQKQVMARDDDAWKGGK